MLTDEQLGKIAFDAYYESGDDEETVADWTAVARAVRAALLPDVAPLAPGETVTIPDRWWLPTDTVYAGLTLNESACYPDLSVIADDGEVGVRVRLDTAGVAALIETCQRWLSAQNETQVVKTGLQSASGAEKA